MDENQLAQQMWNSVAANDKKAAYSLIVRSRANVNLVYGEMPSSPFLTLGKALQQEQPASPPDGSLDFSIAIHMTRFLLESPFPLLARVHAQMTWRTVVKVSPCSILHAVLQKLGWLNYFCSMVLV